MLDMGFIPDIEEICTKLPKSRQTLLFSATLPRSLKTFVRLSLRPNAETIGTPLGDICHVRVHPRTTPVLGVKVPGGGDHSDEGLARSG